MSEGSNTTTLEEEIRNLSHDDLCEITQSSLRRLIAADKLLQDLPGDVTTEEVFAQVAVAQGQSITVTVLRNLETPLSVVIPQLGTTVLDLKKAIRRCFTLRQHRTKSKTKISWKYIWRTYYLKYDGVVMTKDSRLVSFYGLNRQEHLANACSKLYATTGYPKQPPEPPQLDHLLVDHQNKLLYCYVPKVACTNWKRVFMVLTGKSNATHLADIPASEAHADGNLIRLSDLPRDEIKKILHNYNAFVMVRHPFERHLSAFRNKLEGDLPSAKYFQKRIGRQIIRKYRPEPTERDLAEGDNVTFKEFVLYLIAEGSNNDSVNEHWRAVLHLCHPCSIKYSYIAKYETFATDVSALLEYIGLGYLEFPAQRSSNTSQRLESYLHQLSIEDVERLYRVFEADFKLFDYSLDQLLGYDFG